MAAEMAARGDGRLITSRRARSLRAADREPRAGTTVNAERDSRVSVACGLVGQGQALSECSSLSPWGAGSSSSYSMDMIRGPRTAPGDPVETPSRGISRVGGFSI